MGCLTPLSCIEARDTLNSNSVTGHPMKLVIAGGRIVCLRCNAMSKRTRVRCGGPAVKGKTKCRFHGGLSTGPVTKQGKQRCAQAKTIHGRETRLQRQREREGLALIRLYAKILRELGYTYSIG